MIFSVLLLHEQKSKGLSSSQYQNIKHINLETPIWILEKELKQASTNLFYMLTVFLAFERRYLKEEMSLRPETYTKTRGILLASR